MQQLPEELYDIFYVTQLTRGTVLQNIGVDRVRVEPWKCSRNHRHPVAETVLFIEEGFCYVTINDKRHLMKPGDRIYIPAGAWHIVSTFQDELVFISVQFPGIHDEATGRHDMELFVEEEVKD